MIMAVIYGIDELFNAVKTGHKNFSKDAAEKVKKEVAILDQLKQITQIGKESLRILKQIIKHVSKEEWDDAKIIYAKAELGYSEQLRGYLTSKLKETGEVERLPQGNPKVEVPNRGSDDVENVKRKGQQSDERIRSRSNERSLQISEHTNDGKDALSKKHSLKQLHGRKDSCSSQHSHQSSKYLNDRESSNSNQYWNETPKQLKDGESYCPNQHFNQTTQWAKDRKVPRSSQPQQIRGPGDFSNLRRKRTSERKTFSSSNQSEELMKMEESKRASEVMRHNNPDIADLSDPNRPTKIAERFSELYDNEWAEAFEEIRRNNKTEKETIEYLLSIVNQAYKFCAVKAEVEIKLIVKVFDRILELGPQDYKKQELKSQRCNSIHSDAGTDLILQYRREMGDIALPKLINEFIEELNKWNKRLKLQTRLNAVEHFAMEVIELTWWMCVHDPPVFLCPTGESGKQNIDTSLYRVYTKTSTKADFFVWPALRLYEEGAELMKGVVQYL